MRIAARTTRNVTDSPRLASAALVQSHGTRPRDAEAGVGEGVASDVAAAVAAPGEPSAAAEPSLLSLLACAPSVGAGAEPAALSDGVAGVLRERLAMGTDDTGGEGAAVSLVREYSSG